MWNKFTAQYVAGIVAGAGLLLFLLALAADAEMLRAESLRGAGVKFAGLAMVLAGGGSQWRSKQNAPK